MKIILIMGLPGAGKTTLADELAPMLKAKRLERSIKRVASLSLRDARLKIIEPDKSYIIIIVKILWVDHLKKDHL